MKNPLKESFFALVIIFTLVVVAISASINTPAPPDELSEEKPPTTVKIPDYKEGEIVFETLKNKVCEELNLCWVAGGYAINGDKILKKQFPTNWGGNSVLIIPKTEWDGLSNLDKKELGNYLKNRLFVNEIIVGKIIPARYADDTINYDRNVLTVDETVWTSGK